MARKKDPSSKRAAEGRDGSAEPRRKSFSEQYMPYIWAALALFLTVCFVLDVIGQAETPDEHLMGFVGYWICRGLFGLFGWAAFLLPAVTVMMTISWRRYCRDHLVGLQLGMSMLFMLLLSAFVHVCVCTADVELLTAQPGVLFETGADLESGGILGGWLGWLMYKGLRLPGSIVLMIIAMPLIVAFLIGKTPMDIADMIGKKIKEKADERREDRAAIREEQRIGRQEEREFRREEKIEAVRREREARAAERIAAREEAAAAEAERKKRRARRNEPDVYDEPDNDDYDVYDEEDMDTPAKPTRRSRRDEPETAPEEKEAVVVMAGRRRDADRRDDDSRRDDRRGDDRRDDSRSDDSRNDRRPDTTPEERAVMVDPETGEVLEPSAETRRRATPMAQPGERPSATHMEIDMDADPDEVEMDAAGDAADETDGEDEPEGRVIRAGAGGSIKVTVLPPESAAMTGTPDNPVDGLPGEEIEPSDMAAPDAPEYVFPPLDLLTKGSAKFEADEGQIHRNTMILQDTLESFKIRVKSISCSCGPTVTRYEVKPEAGVRVRSIANLVDDIAMNLAKAGVRIEAPIPGKSAVGIEVPNENPSTVYLRNLLEAPEFQSAKSRLTSCLGYEVSGRPVIFDINKMPHLLVAGTTGSGKSVCINCIVLSILYKAKPEEVKLIMVDPKKVEFSMYRDIPHLYCPIVTDPKKAAGALYSAVAEMERRFELIEEVGVRNLAGYNEVTAGDNEHPPMPQMVIIIDELADLMMTAPSDVENAICRIAQKGRAAGMHLILGTQRPSVDVITGLIKANVPSRIAFTVKSQVDSRTIIDVGGAEKLIGRGDMLYAPVGSTKPLRVQGAFAADGEVEKVVTFVKEHNAKPVYDEAFMQTIDAEAARCGSGKKKGDDMPSSDDLNASSSGGDPKYWEAVEVAVEANKVSTSLLQRRLELGYGRAAKIIDRMQEDGFVSPADGNKPRRVLITPQDLAEIKMNQK